MCDRFPCFRKRSGDIAGAVDPQDGQRSIARIFEIMGHVGGYKRAVHWPQLHKLAADQSFGFPREDRNLFGAIMGMQRRCAARRKLRRSGGEGGGFVCIATYHQPRFDKITARERLNLIISYYRPIRHHIDLCV